MTVFLAVAFCGWKKDLKTGSAIPMSIVCLVAVLQFGRAEHVKATQMRLHFIGIAEQNSRQALGRRRETGFSKYSKPPTVFKLESFALALQFLPDSPNAETAVACFDVVKEHDSAG